MPSVRADHPSSPPALRRPTVLIVDDDESLRDTLEVLLKPNGYRVLKAADGLEALDLVRRHRVDVAFVDVHMPGGPGGIEVLGQLRARFADIEVIMCSMDRDVRVVVQAIKGGAFDYITKDFGALSKAHELVDRALLKTGMLHDPPSPPRSNAQRALDVGMVIGRGPRMLELVDTVAKVAAAPTTVLLAGESGTGKELVARLLHRWSARADGPFVAVNLAAVPAELAESILFGHERGAFTGAVRSTPGRFEIADGGTLFLDEVGDLPLEVQGKMLRAIQEREVERVGGKHPLPIDVRLVAATHVDLAAAVKAGRFREDLYYRLNVVPLRVPTLRERRDEIPELALFFARKFAARARREMPGFTEAAMARLLAYEWPGNVRELSNVVERLVALCERPSFDVDDLPAELRRDGVAAEPGEGDLLQVACDAFERNFLEKALERFVWNKAACARALGISYATMKNKVSKYGIGERGRRRHASASFGSGPDDRGARRR